MKKHRKAAKKLAFATVIALALAIAGIGVAGVLDWYQATHEPIAIIDSAISTSSEVVPSETKPTEACARYTVPDILPRSISIPSLGVEGCIQRVSVDAAGVMAVPSNIHVAGWYTGSVEPGDKGLAIINGHAGGRYADGIFRHLSKLSNGDTFSIQMGDMSWREFQVTSVETYALSDAAAPLFYDDPEYENELHLVTCSGTFDDGRQTYTDRTIVVATLK